MSIAAHIFAASSAYASQRFAGIDTCRKMTIIYDGVTISATDAKIRHENAGKR